MKFKTTSFICPCFFYNNFIIFEVLKSTNIVDDKFHDELRSLAKSNTLLPLLTDNFEHVVPEIHIELTIKDVFLNCWYSKKNSTYYFL